MYLVDRTVGTVAEVSSKAFWELSGRNPRRPRGLVEKLEEKENKVTLTLLQESYNGRMHYLSPEQMSHLKKRGWLDEKAQEPIDLRREARVELAHMENENEARRPLERMVLTYRSSVEALMAPVK